METVPAAGTDGFVGPMPAPHVFVRAVDSVWRWVKFLPLVIPAFFIWVLTAECDAKKPQNWRIKVKPGMMLNQFKVEQRIVWPFWNEVKGIGGGGCEARPDKVFKTFAQAQEYVNARMRLAREIEREERDDWVVVTNDPNAGLMVKFIEGTPPPGPMASTNGPGGLGLTVRYFLTATNQLSPTLTMTNMVFDSLRFTNLVCNDPNCPFCRPPTIPTNKPAVRVKDPRLKES